VSATATTAGSTSACPDTTAPSTPTGLATSAVGQSSATLSWTASTDNVGVTGYRMFLGGSLVTTAFSTSYVFGALSCGTAYTLGVAAVDAAGNVSGTATIGVNTSACSGPAASVFVSTSGTDSTCVRGDATKPCKTFDKAFAVASCGDTVSVAAGTYAGQGVSAAKSCTAATPVTFTPSGSVSFTGNVSANSSYITFDGFTFANTYSVSQGASYVTFHNVSAPHAFILGSHVLIQGGQIGPNNNCQTGWEDGLQIWDNGSVSASFVTVDGVIFHDVTDNGNECAGFPNSGVHTDCIQMLGPNNVTIQNSVFYNCATSGIIARPYTTPLHDITIQNNMIGLIITPGAPINLGGSGDTCNNVLVRYNTILDYPSLICGGAGSSGNIATGNIFAGYYSQTGFANSYNVSIDTTPTGPGSKQCSPTFANPAGEATGDYHLSTSDTCAKNAGNPGNYPASDIDGTSRPRGTAPDAGAHEVG
jgi:fibronectin type III domain protein